MTDTAATGLYAKLAKVINEVSEVSNDARNDHFNYSYTSAEAMLRALRGPLAEKNISLLASVTGIDDREYQTSQGKASVITTVHIDFTFVDGDTGDMHKCSWAGRGDDQADKGLGKAYTNAIKTFLREQFLIPQGDDPDGQPAGERVPSGGARNGNLASEKQRNLIRARARDNNVSNARLSEIIRTAADGEPKVFVTDEEALADVDKLLAHLPWPLVDKILPELDAPVAEPVAEPEEIPF